MCGHLLLFIRVSSFLKDLHAPFTPVGHIYCEHFPQFPLNFGFLLMHSDPFLFAKSFSIFLSVYCL